MATEKHRRIRPGIPIPPGEILAEELEARNMTPLALASMLECTLEKIESIIEGRTPLTRETAFALEKSLGSKASIWLNLESNYRATKAEIEGNNTP